MIKDVSVDDILYHLHTGKFAKVIEVNMKWGWFRVQFFYDRYEKEYRFTTENQTFTKLSDVERADYYLELENAGITDYWRD